MTSTLLGAALACLLLLSQCEKKESGVVAVPIGFLADVTITPSRSTMQRGDTLWLEANVSDSLLDWHSGHRYRVRSEDLVFRSAIFFQRLQGIGQEPVGIAPTFKLVTQTGQASIGGTYTAPVVPNYDGHYYRFRIGLIPTQPGVTAISLLIAPAEGSKGLNKRLPFIQLPNDAQGRTQRPVLDHSFYVINGGKQTNFDLYSQHTHSMVSRPGATPLQQMYEQNSIFTVDVQ